MKGLIAAYELDGAGGGRRLPPDFDPDTAETGSTNPEAPLWLQFDRMDPDTSQWLEDRPDIPESVRIALLEEDTRPRCVIRLDGVLLILRGINFDVENYDGQTLAVRLWVTERRLITLTRFKVLAIGDLHRTLEDNDGPTDTAGHLEKPLPFGVMT